MTSIKIGFSNNNSLISHAVRFFTRSNISHTWLFLPDLIGGIDLVMEALPGGFHIITYERFKRENNVLDIIDLDVVYNEHSLLRAFGWIDKRYDYFTVLGMLIVLSGRLFGKKWKNIFSSKSINCVESVVYFLQSNKYPGSECLDPSVMTPKDLYDYLKKN